MKRLYVFFLIAFLTAGSALPSHAQSYRSEIKQAEKLGKIIYEHDQAAWHTTDALMADMDAGLEIEGLAGWITVPEARNVRTLFIAKRDGKLFSVWEAVSRGKKVKSFGALETPRALTEYETALWTARQTPPIREQELCADFIPMNTVVFPFRGDAENRIYSYFFSATKKHNEIVLGRHYRFTMSADGTQVLDQRDYSNSCFVIAAPPKDAVGVVGAFASYLHAPYPEEHHIFANLTHGVDLYVTIPEDETL